mgnify:CR=1 FL=1
MPLFKSIKKQISQFVQAEDSFDLKKASSSIDQIYKIEQIDIRSIRKLSTEESITIEPLEKKLAHKAGELDLGFLPEGKSSIDSFILEEPITVLNLNSHVDKLLMNLNIMLLQDILNIDPSSLIHVKGMGQGHIEEIKEKLTRYIEGKILKGCQHIDFESWVKSLMPYTEKKKSYLVLDAFDLSYLISLSPPESVEIRRLNEKNKDEWFDEAKESFNTYDRRRLFHKHLSEVIEIFLKPWMLKRGGFVKLEELLERFDRLSLAKGTFHKAYAFFREIFCESQCPFKQQMLHEHLLVFSSQHVLDQYHTLYQMIESYFYNEKVIYPVDQLIALIEKECSKEWIGFRDNFVRKVICYCPLLNIMRVNGSLYVQKKDV